MDNTKIAAEIFNKLADQYQDKFMDVNLYRESFDFFCSHLKKENAEILELACGPGNITRYLLEKRPDFKILGMDLAPNMIALAKTNNPGAEFLVRDFREISEMDKEYDALICGFGLPYLTKQEAVTFIHDASNLLKPGGLLYISTMEDDHAKSGFKKGSTGDEMYMNYHQEDYLTGAFEQNDLSVLYLERKIYPAGDGTVTTDLLLIGAKRGAALS